MYEEWNGWRAGGAGDRTGRSDSRTQEIAVAAEQRENCVQPLRFLRLLSVPSTALEARPVTSSVSKMLPQPVLPTRTFSRSGKAPLCLSLSLFLHQVQMSLRAAP